MSVEFHEENQMPMRRRKPITGLTQLVIKSGIVQSERSATVVLLVVAVALIALAGWLLLDTATTGALPAPVPNDNWPSERGN